MPDCDADKLPIARERPYGSAVLSLLVAADQRCPAIIGQAHLLYYARFGSHQGVDARLRRAMAENAEKTFAQLKRDADDLCKAIADVDTAMKAAKPEKK
jgi:hypothetical protein